MLSLDRFHIAPIAQALDLNGGATVDCDSINAKLFIGRAVFVFAFDTLATASAVLTINSGATDGAVTSALYFDYAWGGAAIGTAVALSTASCDVPAAFTNANSVTITHGSYDNYVLFCELNLDDMDTANNEEWITCRFTDPGGATGTLDAFVVLEPRYPGSRNETALA